MQNDTHSPEAKDIVIGAGVLILLATVLVMAFRLDGEPERAPVHMSEPPEQTYLHTGPERQFLAELAEVPGLTGDRERDYLGLGHTWCTSMADGGRADEVIPRLGSSAEAIYLDPRFVRPIVGAASLRLCPEQSAAADAYYGGR